MDVTLTLPDGSTRKVAKGSSGADLVAAIGLKRIIAMEVDGEVQGLYRTFDRDAKVKLLTFYDEGGRHAFWHSSAHVFAHAVKRLYPNAKPTIGPPVEQGFYYDFGDLDITPDDFEKIEQEINKIIAEDLPFVRNVITLDQAKEMFKDNKYKVEMATEYAREGEELTTFTDGDFTDLCEGPHIPSTGLIGAIKLTKVSGAYWRGKQDNEQLTRVYGVSFPTAKELRKHLKMLKEARERDHVRLGKKLDLFTQSDVVGQGLPLITPKGAAIWREIYRFIQDEEIKRGYRYTRTPVLTKTELYKISGHLEHYKENMFVFKLGDDEFALRPMTCPHQYMLFKRKKYSYRDLPVRLAEIADLFRYEQSGELHGLIRIRQFTLADAHIICRSDQVEHEFTEVVKLIQFVMKTFGITEYWYRFSKWDPKRKDKYVDEPEKWEATQSTMKHILDKLKLDYVEADDEAAFYGPKLDIQMKNVYGKEETMFTIQIDFVAAERFDLSYIDEHNEDVRPMVIHRSSVGCIERTMALLIEKYAGKFPLWLSPEQVRILTVADRFNPEAQRMVDELVDAGVRATLDGRTESIGKKVREAQIDYVNYICVVGEKELGSRSVTVRSRNNEILGMMSLDDFKKKVRTEIRKRKLDV